MITPTSDAYYFACILGLIIIAEILLVGAGLTIGKWIARRKCKDVPVWITQIFK